MGRGRAKAKQTKVARALKYNSGGTDLDRLRAELSGGSQPPADSAADDPYAYDEGDEEGDEDEDEVVAR